MRSTLFKEVNYNLSKLIADIDMGEIGLPDIQRPFVWKDSKVRDLFDSMYRGFPIGYFLFWANMDSTRQIGTITKQKSSRLLIVDGQQRLTSLYAVLKGIPVIREGYGEERIRIAFRPRDRRFEVTNSIIEKDPEFIADISNLWNGSRNRFVKQYFERLNSARSVSDNDEEDISEAIDRLYDLQTYPFTVLELSSEVEPEEVASIFVRINSTGQRLNQADFILTLMSVFWDDGRKELEEFCRKSRIPSQSRTSPFNYIMHPDPDQLLRVSIGLGFRRARLQQVYSLLRGKNLDTGEFSNTSRDAQFQTLQQAQTYTLNIQHWHDFLKCITRAGFRSEGMVISKVGLLFAQMLYLIGKRDYEIDEFSLRNAIARWFFMSSLTSRYTGAIETTMEQDLTNLCSASNPKDFTSDPTLNG